MTDTTPATPDTPPVEVPIDDLISRYARELATMTQRAILAEAHLAAVLATRD